MKRELIYKSDKSNLEISRSYKQIIVEGYGKNEMLRTFDLERVCNEIEYSNEQKNMYFSISFITIVFILYKLFNLLFNNESITWQDVGVLSIIVILAMITYFTNDGFNGWLRFQKNQKEQITISKKEFDKISDVLRNELKNGLSRETFV